MFSDLACIDIDLVIPCIPLSSLFERNRQPITQSTTCHVVALHSGRFMNEPSPFYFAFIGYKATRRLSAPNSRLILRTSNQLALQPGAPVFARSDRLRGPRLHWLTPLLFNGVFRCHSHSHGPEYPYTRTCTHKQSAHILPHMHAHTLTDIRGGRGWSQGDVEEGGGAHGDSPDRRHASRLVDEAEKPLWIVMVG